MSSRYDQIIAKRRANTPEVFAERKEVKHRKPVHPSRMGIDELGHSVNASQCDISPWDWDIDLSGQLNLAIWQQLCDGYKDAADILARKCCEDPFCEQLYSPTFFLFRHWIELNLKGLLHKFSSIVEVENNESFAQTHELVKPWEKVRDLSFSEGILDQKDSRISSFVSKVNKFIAAMERIDGASIFSRYSYNKKKRTNHWIDIPNVEAMVVAMEDISTVFHWISVEIDLQLMGLERGELDDLDAESWELWEHNT